MTKDFVEVRDPKEQEVCLDPLDLRESLVFQEVLVVRVIKVTQVLGVNPDL